MERARHLHTGRLGESIAVRYLIAKGFSITARNYRKPWGEIDIVAIKDFVTHFVEVKAGLCLTPLMAEGTDRHRPEDHMHDQKRKRFERIIESYVQDTRLAGDYTADVLVVRLDVQRRVARVYPFWNVEL